jgi:hypothetical protein
LRRFRTSQPQVRACRKSWLSSSGHPVNQSTKALSDFAGRGWIRLEGRSVVVSESARLARRAG